MTERTIRRGDYWVRITATGDRWFPFFLAYGWGPGVAEAHPTARSLKSALRKANRYLDRMERREQRKAQAWRATDKAREGR
jgi:hypothetical protein